MAKEALIGLETAKKIAEVWPEAESCLDAMHRAGLKVRDVRSAYRWRRQAEDMLGISLPTINHKFHGGDWRLREGRDVPDRLDFDRPITIVVFSDAHFWPGHTSPAFWILLQIIEELKPDMVIDNGDSWDGASISRHPSGMWQHIPTVRQELDCVMDHMAMIEGAAGDNCMLRRHIGNHDQRWEAYLSQRVPELKEMPGTTISELFEDWDHKISTIINGHLFIKHRYRSGMHSAYNNVLHSGMSIVCGHTHKLSIRAHTDMRGTRYGIETGTLADPWGPQFTYVEHNPRDWRMGFAVISVDGERLHPELVEVHEDGTAFFRGKTYRDR